MDSSTRYAPLGRSTARAAWRVVLGTSTSSIGATEEGYRRLTPDGQYPEELRRPPVHTVHSLGSFVQQALGSPGFR